MKRLGEILLSDEPFAELVMGNTALVRAMVEAGTQVVTAYPGSPTPEIATAIQSISADKRPFYFEFSTNEKVATEVAYGASVNGHLSTVFFKSVGLNVASDTFVQLSLMNLIGGMVIVLGDDPGANSSQNEQDNRHFAYLSYTPVFEPASPDEVYRFYLEAARLSRDKKMPIILRLTTHVCHAREKVSFARRPGADIDRSPRFDISNGPYIPLTETVHVKKRRALQNLIEVETYSQQSGLNQLVDNQNSSRGVITMGLPCLSLLDVIEHSSQPPDILKLGIVYPVPRKLIGDFLTGHAEVKILEELDQQLELEVKRIAFDAGIDVRVIGKADLDDWLGEYTPDKVYDIIHQTWPDILPGKPAPRNNLPEVPARPAQMCPGCGHRSAFMAVKMALADADITVGDIGCHTLGFLRPYQMGQLMMCMGASTGIGTGLSLFNTSRNVIAFMGDSTFFHAGLPGIINAMYNQHNITLVLMENGTTAMTGHQGHPATGYNFNQSTEKIPIRKVLEGLGLTKIYEIDTYQQSKLTELVKQAMSDDEFSVVIARHPCMLKFTREQRRKSGYRLHQVDIDQQKCRQHYTCIEQFACPSFTRTQDGYIGINRDLCIGDASCRQTCPQSAITAPQPAGEKE